MKTIQCIILLAIMFGCATSTKSLTEKKARGRMESLGPDAQGNINTLLEMIEEQSLNTDPGAMRSIPYEFRIPLDSLKKNEVQGIDPSIRFTNRTDSYQCIGGDATKEKVFQIVALPYTSRIRFCPFE